MIQVKTFSHVDKNFLDTDINLFLKELQEIPDSTFEIIDINFSHVKSQDVMTERTFPQYSSQVVYNLVVNDNE